MRDKPRPFSNLFSVLGGIFVVVLGSRGSRLMDRDLCGVVSDGHDQIMIEFCSAALCMRRSAK